MLIHVVAGENPWPPGALSDSPVLLFDHTQ